jgi:GGDEF domain-containing protein
MALFMGDDASQDELLKRADAAMYQAKQDGKNSIRIEAAGV